MNICGIIFKSLKTATCGGVLSMAQSRTLKRAVLCLQDIQQARMSEITGGIKMDALKTIAAASMKEENNILYR